MFPDLDGAGLLLDWAGPFLGLPATDWYGRLHHRLLHGLPGCLLLLLFARWSGLRRIRGLIGLIISFHLHLLLDLAGSRGPDANDLWPVAYLAPFSSAITLVWHGQWALDAWPNVALTAVLIVMVLADARTHGATPLGLVRPDWDPALIAALRRRWPLRRESPSTPSPAGPDHSLAKAGAPGRGSLPAGNGRTNVGRHGNGPDSTPRAG